MRNTLFHLLQASLLVSTVVAFLIPDPIVHFGVGAIAGGVGAIAYQPFDYIKSQIQSDRGGKLYQNSGWNCLVQTLQSDDPQALFKGMSASVTGVAPEKSLKLGVNDILRDGFTAYYGGLGIPLWSQIVSGAVAGACQVLVSSPLDVLKIRMQTRENESEDGEEHPSFSQLLEEVGGPQGLYKGVEACLVRDISFTAVCLPLYSCLLESGLDAFVAGGLSGIVGTFIATPSDMVKTRILTDSEYACDTVRESDPVMLPELLPVQVQPGGGAVLVMGGGNNTMAGPFGVAEAAGGELLTWNEEPKTDANANNPLEVAKRLVDQEGLAVLFTGVYERCGGAIPRFGITLGAHEWLEHYAHTVGLLS